MILVRTWLSFFVLFVSCVFLMSQARAEQYMVSTRCSQPGADYIAFTVDKLDCMTISDRYATYFEKLNAAYNVAAGVKNTDFVYSGIQITCDKGSYLSTVGTPINLTYTVALGIVDGTNQISVEHDTLNVCAVLPDAVPKVDKLVNLPETDLIFAVAVCFSALIGITVGVKLV